VKLAKTDPEQLTRVVAMKALAIAGAKAKAARADVATIAGGENPPPPRGASGARGDRRRHHEGRPDDPRRAE